MRKSLLLVALVITATLPVARATSIVFGGVPTARTVVNAALVTAPPGSLVMAGTFASQAFTINSGVSLAANVASVMSTGGWKQFTLDPSNGLPDPGITNSLTISSIGKVGGTLTDNNSPQADFFNGKPLYLWVFNGTTIGNSTQMGIYRATTATPPWSFPINAGGLGDGTTYSTTNSGAATIAAIGGFGSTTPSQFKLTDQFNISSLPEPSTAAFGILMAFSAVTSRRRRK